MTDSLFRQMLNLLIGEAETRRDEARGEGDDLAGDMWSAVAGNLDSARQRMRK